MKVDEIRKKNKTAKLLWTIFPFGDYKWILSQVRNAEKNGALAIVFCLDANIRSCRYKDQESFYDARKVGKRTNPISPDPERSYFYDWSLIKKISRSTKLPIIAKGVLTTEDAGDATFNLFLDTSGAKKLNFNGIITGTSFSSTVGDISTVSVSFVTTGAITASV